MIEQGLVELVQGNAAVAAIAKAGGYYAQLPQNAALPSWSYLVVSDLTDYELAAPVALGNMRMQIDCYGAVAADALNLAKAIHAVLNGFRGTLADPDRTMVQGCFHMDTMDFSDPASRTFRRMLEYRIWSVSLAAAAIVLADTVPGGGLFSLVVVDGSLETIPVSSGSPSVVLLADTAALGANYQLLVTSGARELVPTVFPGSANVPFTDATTGAAYQLQVTNGELQWIAL